MEGAGSDAEVSLSSSKAQSFLWITPNDEGWEMIGYGLEI